MGPKLVIEDELGTLRDPRETPRTLTRPSGDPADPQKQAQSLGNMATFEIGHFFNSHTTYVCELKKNAQFRK